jgi:hypothetical protein
MHLLDCIETQLICNRLPLVGVTVAAVPHANTPVVLTLHWHGFVEVRLTEVTDANIVAYQPVPSSALQVNEPWRRFEDLENAVLDVAWELGSWDLARTESPPFMRPGSTTRECHECLSAFGQPPALIDGQPTVVAEVPDLGDLLDAAGRSGYVSWMFRPVRCGLWAEVTDDATLEEGGYRNPPCPYVGEPAGPGKSRRIVYRFGRSRTN